MRRLDVIYKEVAKELGLSGSAVKAAYNSYWAFVRETASSLPLDDCHDEESFRKLRASFYVTGLGILRVTWPRMVNKMKKVSRIIENTRRKHDKDKEGEAVVQQDSDDGREV